MILCGVVNDIDGHLERSQLKPELLAILSKCKNHFDGKSVPIYGTASSSATKKDERVCSSDKDAMQDLVFRKFLLLLSFTYLIQNTAEVLNKLFN